MEAVAILTFGTEGGKNVNLRIPKADPGLTGAAAKSAMDRILGAAAVKTESGPINSRVKATVQKITRVDYDVAG